MSLSSANEINDTSEGFLLGAMSDISFQEERLAYSDSVRSLAEEMYRLECRRLCNNKKTTHSFRMKTRTALLVFTTKTARSRETVQGCTYTLS